ncbi:DUF4153 domain-containing protein [Chryseotalea sanaruensis]|uniref:DUF4153 domain-containing protein n=1 Tax=Chryseotalea sanaruensis TaxID=2482724 RepID=A0A401U820_9BACT|nr:DUF4153 domain-containing protein [Chryseotalea sanaruensis]GCC51041.1 DUF4153 domain-containing protein [Chryseotalea sanaruensis]
MKWPSLTRIKEATTQTIFRFPLEIFCALIGTSLLLWQIEQDNADDQVLRLILCAVLGLALFLSLTVMAESYSFTRAKRAITQTLGALLLVLCWFILAPIEAETSIIRYSFLIVAFHLLVSFAPKTSIEAFWEYNKQLFIRILTAGLYSGVLYIGLCIAIGSTDFLFDLDLDSKIYLRLFVVIAGLFNTVFFLAGVPTHFENLQQDYPKGLKIFTQYVLIPLATIYLCIILLYEGKVLLEWSLPKGVISWLILGYAVYGILSILLVHPVRHSEGNNWIKNYSRLFYILMVPLLPLLCLAIVVRIQSYGITELRYVVLVLAAWLTGITLYFLFSKQQNIKIIPFSLAVLALLSAWGPQSASSVSENSQRNRLINLFKDQGSWKDDKLEPMPSSIPDSIGNETITQLRFMTERYGAASLRTILPQSLNDSIAKRDTIKNRYTKRYAGTELLRRELGLKSYYSRNKNNFTEYYQASTGASDFLIEGYSRMFSISWYNSRIGGSTIEQDGDMVRIQIGDTLYEIDLLNVFKNIEVLEEAETRNKMDTDQLTININQNSQQAKLIIRQINYEKDTTDRKISNLQGFLLLK